MTWMPKTATLLGNPTQTPAGYMPKSAIPVQQPQQGQNQYSVGGFLSNLLTSGEKFAGGIGNAITHPVQSIENIGGLAAGISHDASLASLGLTPDVTDVTTPMAQLANKVGLLPNNSPLLNPQGTVNAVTQNYVNRYGNPQKIADTAYNDPVGTAADVSTVLSGGAGLAGDTSMLGKILNTASDVTNPLYAPLAATSKVVSPALTKAGATLNDTGKQVVLKGLRPSPSQLTNFKNITGMDLADFLQKNNITGNFAPQAKQHLTDLYGQYDQAANQSGKIVPFSTLQANFQPMIDQFKNSTLNALKSKAQDMQDYLDNVQSVHGDNIPLSNIVSERQQMDSMLKQGQFSLPPEQANFYKNARDGLKTTIDQATEGQTKQLGTQIKNFEAFNDIAKKQANLGRGSKQFGLLPTLLTTLGAHIGGIPGAIAGYSASNLADNPRAVSLESNMLKGTGNAVASGGQALATGTQKYGALVTYLRNLGVLNQATTGGQ